MHRAQILPLSTGDVGYQIFGEQSFQHTIVYCHGFPGSRVEAGVAHKSAKKRGLTILSVDRPGIGHSAPRSQWKLADWPMLFVELLDHFQVKKAGLLGLSGGTPYALIASAMCADRVNQTVIVSGVSPFIHTAAMKQAAFMSRAAIVASQRLPLLSRMSMALMTRWFRRYPRHLLMMMSSSLGEDDKKLLARRAIRFLMYRNIKEAFRQGSAGVEEDFVRLSSAWPFERENIATSVAILHGDADLWIPSSMAKNNHEAIPQSSYEIFSGRGHFMVLGIIREVLDKFIEPKD